MIQLMAHGWLRQDKKISEVWVADDAPSMSRAFAQFYGSMTGVKSRIWKTDQTT
jgi:hypothetical protein